MSGIDRTPTACAPKEAGHVIHVVGRMTDAVFSFLGPSTLALAQRGVQQTVILRDDPAYRRLLPRFHASIRLVLLPATGHVVRPLAAMLEAMQREVSAAPNSSLHLHGVVPCLAAVYGARMLSQGQPCYFSPHGSRSLGPLRRIGSLLLKSLRPLSGPLAQHAIANVPVDARALTVITHQPVDLIESPVDRLFFDARHQEALQPLIVTGSRARHPRSAALFAQIAVLLGEEDLGLSCHWIGSADADSLARLEAAHVSVFDVDDDTERAKRLASGWLYLAAGGTHGFPVFLAEAMAVGLPCVAWDTPYHRDLLRHGETGLLCSNDRELLDCIATLIDSPELRARLGNTARLEALSRFDPDRFRTSLLAAYRIRVTSE